MAQAQRPDDAVMLTGTQLQELLAAVANNSNESIKELVQALRAPTTEEAVKIEAAKARADANRAGLIEACRAEEAATKARQEACSHRKDNQRSAIGGQIHNDGLFHGHCVQCHKFFTPTKPHSDMVSGGVNMV